MWLNIKRQILWSITKLRQVEGAINLLFMHGADVHACNFEGLTPLHIIASTR